MLCRGGWRGLGDFFCSCNEGRLNRLYLVLHAWEWVILGLIAAVAWGSWTAAMVVLGMAWHLAFDQAGNRDIVRPGFYWITRRARVGFDAVRLYRDPGRIYA
jgi:protein-S-isoprenylcysteine O-methyltransferase Ste14